MYTLSKKCIRSVHIYNKFNGHFWAKHGLAGRFLDFSSITKVNFRDKWRSIRPSCHPSDSVTALKGTQFTDPTTESPTHTLSFQFLEPRQTTLEGRKRQTPLCQLCDASHHSFTAPCTALRAFLIIELYAVLKRH